VAQLGARFHGMEEVVGSIPTRSTKSPVSKPAVYILQSQSNNRFYIGCAEDPLLRLTEHQRGQTISTRGRGPWVLVYQERFGTLTDARSRERQRRVGNHIVRFQELIETSKAGPERATALSLRRGISSDSQLTRRSGERRCHGS
jgi:predicted GIY-YIG superfamily endonuclease